MKNKTNGTFKYMKCTCGKSFMQSATVYPDGKVICNRCKRDITNEFLVKQK